MNIAFAPHGQPDFSVAVPVIRRKQGDMGRKGFRVPFGPYVVPGLSILACLYLVGGRSSTTYTMFAIWMAVTVLAYFGYGIHNSRLNEVTVRQTEEIRSPEYTILSIREKKSTMSRLIDEPLCLSAT